MPAVSQNGGTTINLYLDEVGALKKLPLNSRGGALAAACGYVDVPFYGDLFVGRVQGKQNQDFRIAEMASDAAWITGAVAANLEHSQAMSKFNAEMGGMGGMQAVDTEAGPTRTEDDGTKGYSWEQTEEDLDVEISLPPGLTTKHLTVKILPRKIAVSWPAVGVAKEGEFALNLFGNFTPSMRLCRCKISESPILIETFPFSTSTLSLLTACLGLAGLAADGIRPDESTWTMDGPCKIILSMEKASEGNWPILVEEETDGGLSL